MIKKNTKQIVLPVVAVKADAGLQFFVLLHYGRVFSQI